jgi:hypothetical protein
MPRSSITFISSLEINIVISYTPILLFFSLLKAITDLLELLGVGEAIHSYRPCQQLEVSSFLVSRKLTPEIPPGLVLHY